MIILKRNVLKFINTVFAKFSLLNMKILIVQLFEHEFSTFKRRKAPLKMHVSV